MTPIAGNRVADLYRELGPLVYRRCLRVLRDRAAAQDATQEVFVKLLGNIEKLQDRATVVPWIYRVATNHCLNLRRDVVRHGEEAATEEDAAFAGTGGVSRPDSNVDRALARSLLARFDTRTQSIAVAVLVDGMTHEEAAEALEISRRTVSRKLERFLEAARRFVGVEGGHPEMNQPSDSTLPLSTRQCDVVHRSANASSWVTSRSAPG